MFVDPSSRQPELEVPLFWTIVTVHIGSSDQNRRGGEA